MKAQTPGQRPTPPPQSTAWPAPGNAAAGRGSGSRPTNCMQSAAMRRQASSSFRADSRSAGCPPASRWISDFRAAPRSPRPIRMQPDVRRMFSSSSSRSESSTACFLGNREAQSWHGGDRPVCGPRHRREYKIQSLVSVAAGSANPLQSALAPALVCLSVWSGASDAKGNKQNARPLLNVHLLQGHRNYAAATNFLVARSEQRISEQ